MAIKLIVINNKGGVGKSLLNLWLAHALSLLNKKVLILTSDNQNNGLHYAGADINFTSGLEEWIEKGDGELYRLRENLFYIPLKNFKIKKSFEDKFNAFIQKMNSEYDYIIIDASPVLGLNDFFIKISDYFIIPTFLDEATTDSIVNLISVIDKHKILAVIPNRAGRSNYEKYMYRSLQEILSADNIMLTKPIMQSSFVLNAAAKGKTIWEFKNKKAQEIQEILSEVLEVVINE